MRQPNSAVALILSQTWATFRRPFAFCDVIITDLIFDWIEHCDLVSDGKNRARSICAIHWINHCFKPVADWIKNFPRPPDSAKVSRTRQPPLANCSSRMSTFQRTESVPRRKSHKRTRKLGLWRQLQCTSFGFLS